MIAVFSFAAVSCIDEIGNTDIPTAETGDEVQFGLSLPDAKTRTVYGDESGNAFPIYWVAGDKVQIFSPQCLEGRRSAEYEVTLPDEGNAYYAKALTKTGEAGVQWGDNDKAVFYSLYPSGNYSLSEDGTQAKNIVINYSQNIIVDGDDVKSDMEDCLMYAKNDGGEENNYEGVPKGETVNLHYDPISTVFMVTLNVPSNSADDFTIQSVSLIATKDIAGTFNLNISNGSFAGWGNNKSATVAAQIFDKATGGYYTLVKGKNVQIPIFLAPVEGLNTDGWQIRVVANNTEYLKTLGSQDVVAGKIHKVTLPNLSTEEEEEEWDVSHWMTYIPGNVYLSEVSIPGSWNSLNPEFQGSSPTISSQYANGARAFHLDTRWKRSGTYGNYTYTLGTANGGNTAEVVSDGRVMTDSNNPTFLESLTEITSNVKDDEYMVLICTFAQGSYNYTDSNNATWIDAISTACASNSKVYDAKALTANTLVGDVLGKVIVIINSEGEMSSTPSDSKCLFVNTPLTLNSSLFGSDLNNNKVGINKGTAKSTGISDTGIDMYNTQAQVCIAGETYTASTNRSNVDGRGFAPTFGERKTVANNILSWSKKNYDNENYSHDTWIYMGLGGYYVEYGSYGFLQYGWHAADNGHANVASDLNGWINGKVTEMGTTPSGQTTVVPYYPVGIVLMNYVNNYASTAKNILLLNSKYRMQFDSSKPSDYVAPVMTAAASYSSGMQDTGTSAFGWE